MRLPIAEHEAGHVVMALALGIEVATVSCCPGRTECGETFTAAISRADVARSDAKRAALFCLAGVVYESLLAGLYDHGAPIAPPRPVGRATLGDDLPDDLYEAYRFADAVGGFGAARATIVDLMVRAIEILRKNGAGLLAIAEALPQAGMLSGPEVRALWLQHGGRLEPEAI